MVEKITRRHKDTNIIEIPGTRLRPEEGSFSEISTKCFSYYENLTREPPRAVIVLQVCENMVITGSNKPFSYLCHKSFMEFLR